MTHVTPMLLYFLAMFYEIEDIIYVICVHFCTLHFTLSIILAWDFVSLKVFKILISKYLLESHCVLMPNLKYSPSDEYYSQISTIINNAIMKIFVHGDVYKSMIISKNLIKLEQLNEKYILKYCFLQYYFLRKILSFFNVSNYLDNTRFLCYIHIWYMFLFSYNSCFHVLSYTYDYWTTSIYYILPPYPSTNT